MNDKAEPERPFGESTGATFRVPVRKGTRSIRTRVQRDRTKYDRTSEKRPHTHEEESE